MNEAIVVRDIVNRLPCVQYPGGNYCKQKRNILELPPISPETVQVAQPVAQACLSCSEFTRHHFQPGIFAAVG